MFSFLMTFFLKFVLFLIPLDDSYENLWKFLKILKKSSFHVNVHKACTVDEVLQKGLISVL